MSIDSRNGRSTIRLSIEKGVWEMADHVEVSLRYMSRKSLFSFVAFVGDKLQFNLTPEEEADIMEWAPLTIKLAVEDGFIDRGFTWTEMEQWASGCYRMRLNPLPAIREAFDEYAIPVYFRNRYNTSDELVIGLTCIEENSLRKNSIVLLVAHGTLEELATNLAEKERMLKVAGIH